MFYRLAPVGNKIDCTARREDKYGVAELFSSEAFFFNSGAASLAVAISVIVERSEIEQPEVLLPAYACPELVSAILYAGAIPVPVDLAMDQPWMDLEVLSENITEKSCAVIAVSLFGIPERLGDLRKVLGERPICLIEDSAQAFPEKGEEEGAHADLVIYSFGRGKPVSVLGGGAVLVLDRELTPQIAKIHRGAEQSESSAWLNRLKIESYNALISPGFYWLPEMIPFLGLGATRFHPLDKVCQMDSYKLAILGRNVKAYWQRDRGVQNAVTAELAKVENGNLIDLASSCFSGGMSRLLRYPLLAETPALCDDLYRRLNAKGLGASKMYMASLPGIQGLAGRFQDQKGYPNAESFAKRLLTLPLHEYVSDKDITAMLAVIRE